MQDLLLRGVKFSKSLFPFLTTKVQGLKFKVQDHAELTASVLSPHHPAVKPLDDEVGTMRFTIFVIPYLQRQHKL